MATTVEQGLAIAIDVLARQIEELKSSVITAENFAALPDKTQVDIDLDRDGELHYSVRNYSIKGEYHSGYGRSFRSASASFMASWENSVTQKEKADEAARLAEEEAAKLAADPAGEIAEVSDTEDAFAV